MMRSTRAPLLTALLATVVVATAGAQEKVTLHMTGPAWGPISLMTEISKDFTAYAVETLGYEVEIQLDPVPWGSYYERLAAALAAGTPTYDLFVADSQWVGDFADSGHILQLNEYAEADPELQAILDSIHPVLRGAYSAYPAGTENWWGFPQEADVQGFIVRSDLFGHEGERAAFSAKYGYDLPATSDDWNSVEWTQTADFAEFFTRKQGETLAGEELAHDFYGLALTYSKTYDYGTMAWLQLLYNWGGAIWDWDTHRVDGVLNSPAAVESLEFHIGLLEHQPPGAANYDLDAVNNAVAQGIVAMASNWIAVAPPLFDPSVSKVADKLMIVVPPGHDGKRIYNLGGQPFVVGAKTQHVEEVLAYIKWWFQDEQQWRFAKGGGLPATSTLIESDEFKALSPWTRAFADAVPHQRDVWKHPAFFELLTAQQEEFHKAVTGSQTAKEALDNAARRHETILEDWGEYD